MLNGVWFDIFFGDGDEDNSSHQNESITFEREKVRSSRLFCRSRLRPAMRCPSLKPNKQAKELFFAENTTLRKQLAEAEEKAGIARAREEVAILVLSSRCWKWPFEVADEHGAIVAPFSGPPAPVIPASFSRRLHLFSFPVKLYPDPLAFVGTRFGFLVGVIFILVSVSLRRRWAAYSLRRCRCTASIDELLVTIRWKHGCGHNKTAMVVEPRNCS